MSYKSNLSQNKYRVRLFGPNYQKFDEYFVSDTASGAWRQAIEKYKDHKAIVLDWEPI